MKVSPVRQLSVFLRNEPGVLARLCRELAKARISLRGISVSDSVDHAVVRLVVDRPQEARRLFEEHNLLVIESDLTGVRLADRPGELGRVAAALARAGLNISYLYGSAPDDDGSAMVYLRVAAPAGKVRAALSRL